MLVIDDQYWLLHRYLPSVMIGNEISTVVPISRLLVTCSPYCSPQISLMVPQDIGETGLQVKAL